MPNLPTHRKLTLIAACTAAPTAFYLDPLNFAVLELGILITLLPEFGPDLDISRRRFGWLGEFAGMQAYAKLIPHRFGFRKKHYLHLWRRPWILFALSHVPFFGTLPRFLLFTLPLLLVCLLFSWFPSGLPVKLLLIFTGMSYSDVWHVVADRPWQNWHEGSRKYWKMRQRHGIDNS